MQLFMKKQVGKINAFIEFLWGEEHLEI
jgi:hypothetical protein